MCLYLELSIDSFLKSLERPVDQGMIGSGRILVYTLLMMGTTLFIFSVFAVVLITKNDATKDILA